MRRPAARRAPRRRRGRGARGARRGAHPARRAARGLGRRDPRAPRRARRRPVCARCSTPPASCCTPTSGARRSRGAAVRAMAAVAAGYSNLELDLDTGSARQPHRPLPRRCSRALTGAEDALVVNNAAGALRPGAQRAGRRAGRWSISRGELIEIGGSLPDPRHHGEERRAAPRGRHHQPHPPRRLPRGARRGDAAPSSRCTAPTSSSAASSPRPSPPTLAALAARGGRALPATTSAAGCWRISRPGGCAASRGSPTRWPPAPTS